MTDELNITSVDPETGDPDESDEIVKVNGRVPGVGEGPWLYQDGALTTEGPVALEELQAEVSDIDELETRAKDADYNVWQADDGTVYANADGSTGTPSHSGSTLNSVIADVLSSLPSNRQEQAVISLNGEFTGLTDEIVVNDSFTLFDLQGAYLEWDDSVSGDTWMFYIGKDGSSIQGVTLLGGRLSGAGSNGDCIRFFGDWSDGNMSNKVVRTQAEDFRRGIFANIRRTQMIGVKVESCSQYGFKPGNTDQHWQYCIAWNNGGEGFSQIASFVHFYQCIAARNSGAGYSIQDASGGRGVRFYGGWSENNGGIGIDININTTTPIHVEGMGIFNNATTGISISQASDVLVKDCYFLNNSNFSTQTEMVNVASDATDVKLRNLVDESDNQSIVDSGTRTRYEGVIGGGPLGGVDLSTVSGTEDGEKAMSDGTATGFPAFAEARWDSANSQWVRVDGQATV